MRPRLSRLSIVFFVAAAACGRAVLDGGSTRAGGGGSDVPITGSGGARAVAPDAGGPPPPPGPGCESIAAPGPGWTEVAAPRELDGLKLTDIWAAGDDDFFFAGHVVPPADQPAALAYAPRIVRWARGCWS